MSVKSSDPNAPLIIIGLLATGSFFDNRHLDVSRLRSNVSGYLFLAAICVETVCVLNIINTSAASRLTADLTATDTARRADLIG